MNRGKVVGGMKRKPKIKPMIDSKGNHIDDIVVCGHCGAFICYPEDKHKDFFYRACDNCGMPIDWEGGVSNEND